MEEKIENLAEKYGATPSFIEKMDKTERELEGERRIRDMEARLAKLGEGSRKIAEQAAEFALEYGNDDFRTEMMVDFLDMVLEIQDSIKLLKATSTVMNVLSQAISLVDDIVNFNEDALLQSTQKRYGFFQRWRAKRRMRKAIRNNNARMLAVYDTILAQQEMAQDMTESLREAAMRMRIRRQKLLEKREDKKRKMAKKGLNPDRLSDSSKARSMVDDIIREKQGVKDVGGGEPPAPPAGESGPSTPSGDSGIDDIA